MDNAWAWDEKKDFWVETSTNSSGPNCIKIKQLEIYEGDIVQYIKAGEELKHG